MKELNENSKMLVCLNCDKKLDCNGKLLTKELEFMLMKSMHKLQIYEERLGYACYIENDELQEMIEDTIDKITKRIKILELVLAKRFPLITT